MTTDTRETQQPDDAAPTVEDVSAIWLRAAHQGIDILHQQGGSITELLPILKELHGGTVSLPTVAELQHLIADVVDGPDGQAGFLARAVRWIYGLFGLTAGRP